MWGGGSCKHRHITTIAAWAEGNGKDAMLQRASHAWTSHVRIEYGPCRPCGGRVWARRGDAPMPWMQLKARIELFKLPQIDRAFSATSSRASRLSTILFPDDLGGLPLPSAGAVADFDGAAATQIGDPSRARSSSDLIVNDQVEPCTPNFFIFFKKRKSDMARVGCC